MLAGDGDYSFFEFCLNPRCLDTLSKSYDRDAVVVSVLRKNKMYV